MAALKDIIHQKFPTAIVDNIKKEENNEDIKKESSTETETSTESQTPLAVPMVADTKHQSLSRNDAKVITESRLKRLKELSQKPEESLSKPQKDEKRRIVRLEKNRRAASMSRRKKKMYVSGLEEKCNLMGRHLTILEMENRHLKALLSQRSAANMQNMPPNMQSMPPNMAAHPHMPPGLPFRIPHMPNFLPRNNPNYTHTNLHQSRTNSEDCISESEPAMKRRRLNDGTILNRDITMSQCSPTLTPPTVSCDTLSDITPLPIEPISPLPIINNVPMSDIRSYTQPKIEDMNAAVPPAIFVPDLDLVFEDEDCDLIEETVDGYGSVIEFEMNLSNPLYL